MKCFSSTKTLIYKAKNGENVQSPEVVEVALPQCILLDNQDQQKSEISYIIQ